MWAANKVWHFPAGTLSVELGAGLGELGLRKLGSATAACAAALVRTATDGKVEWKENLSLMEAAAQGSQSQARWAAGLWWGSHWKAAPFAKNLEQAATGTTFIASCSGPAAAAAGAATAKQRTRPKTGLLALKSQKGRTLQADIQMSIEQELFAPTSPERLPRDGPKSSQAWKSRSRRSRRLCRRCQAFPTTRSPPV